MADKPEYLETKANVAPFMGGARVNLKKKIKGEVLKEVLGKEIDNQELLINRAIDREVIKLDKSIHFIQKEHI